MTELAESIAIGMFEEAPVECPLDHADPKPIDSENDFVGDGGTLGDAMAAQTSTIHYPPNRRSKPAKDPYPKGRAKLAWPILIEGHYYPVTCAAHHLIPAQASLKKANTLHDWMVYKKKPQPLGGSGGASTASGVVWADVGYNVNGAENGVWLPGNYAVGGNGTREWTRAASAYPDSEQASAPPAPPKPPKSSRSLAGLRHTFDDDNRKSQYVKQATWLFGAQFHDSHGDYSDFVTGILQKLGTLYAERKSEWQSDCPKCKERFKKIKDEGTPTHFSLAHRLNGVSQRLRGFLTGSRGHKTVYTSTWGRAAADDGLGALEKRIPR